MLIKSTLSSSDLVKAGWHRSRYKNGTVWVLSIPTHSWWPTCITSYGALRYVPPQLTTINFSAHCGATQSPQQPNSLRVWNWQQEVFYHTERKPWNRFWPGSASPTNSPPLNASLLRGIQHLVSCLASNPGDAIQLMLWTISTFVHPDVRDRSR